MAIARSTGQRKDKPPGGPQSAGAHLACRPPTPPGRPQLLRAPRPAGNGAHGVTHRAGRRQTPRLRNGRHRPSGRGASRGRLRRPDHAHMREYLSRLGGLPGVDQPSSGPPPGVSRAKIAPWRPANVGAATVDSSPPPDFPSFWPWYSSCCEDCPRRRSAAARGEGVAQP